MNKEQEIEFYRKNVIPRYVLELKQRDNKNEIKGVMVKKCKKCGEIKELSAFYNNPLKSQGVFDVCKKCISKGKNVKGRVKFT